jgi:hypothetical protein
MATKFSPEDLRFAGSLSGINPAELEPDALQKYQKTIEEQIAALEQRYAEPNWFKVAAGFAKPQLGGFLASLGSAAEAMGETVEQQREQMLPIAQMKVAVEQANLLLGSKKKQDQLFQEWRASGKPMDEATYTRIASLDPQGTETPVSKAAKQYWEQARQRVGAATEAEAAASKYPKLDEAFSAYISAAADPKADPSVVEQRNKTVLTQLNAAKPPQTDQAQWDGMSRLQKMEEVERYARAQREAGMGAEATFQQQASQAPSRLSLLGSIRDLALGVGLKDVTKKVDGKDVTVNGQQQMAALLNYFGGNNPFEVLARAAADGKLGEKLADIDKYARQNAMSPAARDHFQKLSKLLAENQVSLRNSTLNPTDASSMLQQAGSPNIGNSQTALASLVDLMGHSEQNAIERYKYVLDNRIPYRQLGVDPGYLQKQAKYADEHRQIATSNPLIKTPSWYNPARSVAGEGQTTVAPAGGTTAAPATPASPAAPAGAAPSRPAAARTNERVIGGKTYVRQADGSWKIKE